MGQEGSVQTPIPIVLASARRAGTAQRKYFLSIPPNEGSDILAFLEHGARHGPWLPLFPSFPSQKAGSAITGLAFAAPAQSGRR